MAFSSDERQATAAGRKNYRAFLLRCWQEKVAGTSVWRFTLVQINGGQSKHGFAGMEELVDYLNAELDINLDRPEKST
ncbi:MAG TPA: hypothetical protein VFZ76_10195 [Anaerolineales bacterium]